MKNLFYLFVLVFILSCSSLKEKSSNVSFNLINDEIKINENLSLKVITMDGKFNNLLMNENFNYFKNYIYINDIGLTAFIKIIVTDEEENEVHILKGGNSIHFVDYTKFKKEITENEYCKLTLKTIKSNSYYVAEIPFITKVIDKNTYETYEYYFLKDKKYFVRLEYIPNQKIIDSLSKKGINVYDKPIISNKVPIIIE